MYVHVDGSLDVAALTRAFEHVVRTHDALRLVFFAEDDVPGQRIAEQVAVDPAYHDLSGADAAAVEAWLRRELARPFDLENGPLLRFIVLKTGQDRHTWALQRHHLLFDGWGAMLVFQRIVATYNAILADQPPPPPGSSYADFVADDLAYAASEQYQRDAAFWQDTYRRLPAPLLPPNGADGPRRLSRLRVDRGTFAALRSFADTHGSTPFKVVLGLLYCYFVRIGQRDDFAVGLATLNRGTEEFRRTVGQFTNVVPAWYRFGSALSFRELLRALDEQTQRAAPHRRFPCDELKRLVGASRSEDTRLFDVTLTYLAGTYEARLGDTPVSLRLMSGFAPESLAIQAMQTEGGLEMLFDACPTIMTSDEVARLPSRLERLLGSILRDADAPVRDLQLLPDDELAQLTAWNDTAAEFPHHRCIHELFEAQAARFPDAVAVVFEQTSLTYAELDARANRLARHLVALGVGPETRVGLFLDRSLDLMVGMLAILKAGGAYVPLDPAYPTDRLAFMLTDARAPVLLTHAGLADKAPASDAQIVRLDANAWQWNNQPDTPPLSKVGPDNLAYVIYTSGSTGRPKGVGVVHRSVVNQICHEAELLGVRPGVPVLQFSSIGFDASVAQIFSTLCHGARLVLASDEQRRSREALTGLLRGCAVEVAEVPPSALSLVDGEALSALRVLTFGGEASHAAMLAPLAQGRRLVNLYGPTEATITTATWEGPLPEGPLPLGRANANNRLHVLSPALQRTPIGVPGELYIAGIAIARGYLGRPALTAERLLPDPFGPPGTRMYRTGDLARWNHDGQLEFLGRLDDQVKIRGYRIELGEIEATLARHPSVAQCAVLVKDGAEGKRLVAYVASPSQPPTAAQLREHLLKSLPDHMVPAAFVFLGAMPLTPNGKIDRKALPEPDVALSASNEHVAPRTPTERALVDVWEELLEVEPVGVTDDFFALGGHSLLAVRVLSAIRTRLGRAPAMASLFEHPTIAALARILDDGEDATTAALQPIARAFGEPAFSGLSGNERRIWFLERLHPGARSYQVPQLLRVPGPLDEPALRHSLVALAARHELLRTRYPEHAGSPVREVTEDAGPTLRVADLSALPSTEQDRARQALLSAEVATPFDLTRGPLTRVLAVSVAPDEHLLLVHQHHIINDEWSFAILMRDWSALYAAARHGTQADLPPVPFQYRALARAEHAALEHGDFSPSRAYWKQQLAGVPRLVLPIVRPASSSGPGLEAHLSLPVEPALHAALLSLARANACTPFIAYLAVFSAVLSRYSGLSDIALGAVLANRDAPGADLVPGFFTNTVVLRTDLSGDPSFRELLARARTTAVDAYRHQALPFDIVVHDLGLPRSAGQNPLYDVSFFEASTPDIASWTIDNATDLPESIVTAKDPLSLALLQHQDGASLSLAYDTTRVDAPAARRLLDHLFILLQHALARPDVSLSQLDILTAQELVQLAAWNDTAAEFPRHRCIHELFEAQAARSLDAVAVVFEHASLTYAELDARANRLAHHLVALGVGPETRVGLFLDRSLDLVVAILAVLKAGGAYVPLDPAYPVDRLRFMLTDACAPVLLTHARLADRAPASGARIIRLDANASQWTKQPDTPPLSKVGPDNLAYVIYTSGSTGRPKGVGVVHRAVVNLICHEAEQLGVRPGVPVLQFSSIGFDASVAQIFSTLCHGARLVLASDEQRLSREALTGLLRDHAVEIADLPPSALSLVDTEELSALRVLVVGGEACHAAMLAPLARGRRIVNAYGPTEATITTATWEGPLPAGPLPLGRANANNRLHVLTPTLQRAPIGVPGELYIAGVALARGYLGRPALTAERFIPDPFGPPGSRMYRTGDLARWNDDGQLEFLGRLDDQVKIRGYRIELGELEATLARHPSVAQCLVLVKDHAEGKRLVAYVASPSQPPTAAQLREHLLKSLPDHMVPAAFVVLDALPLTPGGKVDRKALPEPEGLGEVAGASHVAPRTDAERVLADVWASLLRLPAVGIHDNFFSLGGDSILAIQAVSRSARAGLHFTVRELFERQTVTALAGVARRHAPALADQSMVTGEVPLTPIQRWFFGSAPAEPDHFNQVMLWTIAPALQRAWVADALASLIQHHDALRLRFHRTPDGWVQTHDPTASLPLEVIACASVEELEQAAGALQAGLSIERGPLARAAWLDLGPGGARLLLVIHHLAVDGVSWRIIHDDLELLLSQRSAGQPLSLGAKTTSMRAWSTRWTEWVAQGGLADELPYWQSQCRRPVPALPLDRSAPLGTFGDSKTRTVTLSQAETEALLRSVPSAYRTEINDVLLAALTDALGTWCDTDTVCIGLEGHGREALPEGLDVSHTVGWFTSIFPVWLTRRSGEDPGALLKAVKEQLRAVPSRGVGHGWLRHAHPDEAVRTSLAVDAPIVFNYLGQFDTGAQGRGLLAAADEPTGVTVGPTFTLDEPLTLNSLVVGGRLQVAFTYSPAVLATATVSRLANALAAALRRLIAHCTSPGVFGYTPSDFPLARLSQPTLDRLLGPGVETVYPLAPMQAGMLFHALKDPASPTYTVQLALQLDRGVDPSALAAAWRTVVARHAVLRTSFLWDDVPEPLQVVHRAVPFSLAHHDLSGLAPADADARFDAFLHDDRHTPFDLRTAPLLRVALVHLPGGATWMVQTEHHIVSDGWSGPLVLADLAAAYAAHRAGLRPTLPAPAPYERYIAWLSRQDPTAAEAFFRRYLADLPGPTRLGLARAAATPDPAREHARLDVSLSPAETAALSAFTRRHGLTVNTVLQGVLALVLGHHAGHRDIVFGVTTAGRSAPVDGIEQMVGLFINTLPLRARWSDHDTALSFLSALQADQAAVRAFESTPLYDIQRWAAAPRGQHLFDTLLVFENYPLGDATAASALPVLAWRTFEQTNYPLTIAAFVHNVLSLRLSWDDASLSRAAARRLGGHLITLIQHILARPDAPLSQLGILCADEPAP